MALCVEVLPRAKRRQIMRALDVYEAALHKQAQAASAPATSAQPPTSTSTSTATRDDAGDTGAARRDLLVLLEAGGKPADAGAGIRD